jgi:hypothetical protein
LESEKGRLDEENKNLKIETEQSRSEQEILLPLVIQEREELSAKVTDLGGRLQDVVAELVAEHEVSGRSSEVNQRYWAVEDRRRLLTAVSEWLETEERERSQNAERIARKIQQLEDLNVRQGLNRIKALSEGAGVKSSITILAILDDMLASVPQLNISSETTSRIDEYSTYVDGLGINTRFIPRALIEICRELATNTPPEEVEQVERIILRIIEVSRIRF